MMVSVVLSTYSKDNFNQVLDCIESLGHQTFPPEEIILVLDSDPDLITYYKSIFNGRVKIVDSGGFGLSRARNAGIQAAKSEIVAFIDDDAIADPSWLHNLLKDYDSASVVSVGGLIKPLWEQQRPKWFPAELDWVVGCSYKGLPEIRAYVRNAIGCNMSFRKKIFDDVGYFRTDLGRFGKHLLGSEEPELSTRILTNNPNSKIIYDPEAIVFHKVPLGRRKFSYLFRRSFYEGLSKAFFSLKLNSNRKLSTEKNYLRYLLTKSFPFRIVRFYRLQCLAQLFVLSFSFLAVFLGFLFGKILLIK